MHACGGTKQRRNLNQNSGSCEIWRGFHRGSKLRVSKSVNNLIVLFSKQGSHLCWIKFLAILKSIKSKMFQSPCQ